LSAATPDRVRLFVALEVPDRVRARLARWARDAVGGDAALRLVAADSMHLTLAFLGHRPADEVEPLGAAVAGAGGAAVAGPVRLRVGEALWLAPRRPHVLTVAVDDPESAAAALYDALWERLEALGHEREKRAFRPHVTVARVRHGARVRPRELPAPPGASFTAPALTLFRSHLGGGRPARYEALVRAQFPSEG
jgi:RNA 2',3'-cyclic 3'-phosphodiesterase